MLSCTLKDIADFSCSHENGRALSTLAQVMINIWRHQAITWTNSDLHSVRYRGIYSRPVFTWILKITTSVLFLCASCVWNLYIWNHTHVPQVTLWVNAFIMTAKFELCKGELKVHGCLLMYFRNIKLIELFWYICYSIDITAIIQIRTM